MAVHGNTPAQLFLKCQASWMAIGVGAVSPKHTFKAVGIILGFCSSSSENPESERDIWIQQLKSD